MSSSFTIFINLVSVVMAAPLALASFMQYDESANGWMAIEAARAPFSMMPLPQTRKRYWPFESYMGSSRMPMPGRLGWFGFVLVRELPVLAGGALARRIQFWFGKAGRPAD
jgi:hypothetical protein